jgi:hypothetical protein
MNVVDAVAIFRHVVGTAPLTGANLTNADANGDGSVNVTDAVYVLQAVVNIAPGNQAITSLTCE